MSDGRLDVGPLISHRYKIEDAIEAYNLVASPGSSLGIILEYPSSNAKTFSRSIRLQSHGDVITGKGSKVTVGFIGTGNYSTRVLIPFFKGAGAKLKSLANAGGISSVYAGRKYGFDHVTTNVENMIADPEINALIIATKHDSHANLVVRSLRAGKNVFVEKPLCLNYEELKEIKLAYLSTIKGLKQPILMVGFNRRFAPQIKKIKQLLDSTTGKKVFVMTVNAGDISLDHWTQDSQSGGGRIIGEACHFIDLLRFLAGVSIATIHCVSLDTLTRDTATLQLNFSDGSIGTVHYLANGNKSFPKERLEIFVDGRILQLDNFRKLTGFGWPSFRRMNLWYQDKGQRLCTKAFMGAIEQGSSSPIPFDELIEVSRVSIELAGAMNNAG
jgi:predicted dehydrogenase